MCTHEGQLIPGLCDRVVLDCLLPRIPWHTRPRMMAVSKVWKETLQNPMAYGGLTLRESGGEKGLVIAHHVGEEEAKQYFEEVKIDRWMPEPHGLSIYDEENKKWRLLPPIPALRPLRLLHDGGVCCVDKKLFVIGGWDPKTYGVSAEVYMLDLGSGLWQWQRRRSMQIPKSFFHCTSMAGKIYVAGGFSVLSPPDRKEPACPEVYDVERDEWELLPPVTQLPDFRCQGLAVVGQQVVAQGTSTCAESDGEFEVVKCCKAYDPSLQARKWSEWDCDVGSCSALQLGDHDLRDGSVYKLDSRSRHWREFEGKLASEVCWGWDTSETNGFLVVMNEGTKPHVYATELDSTIWRGDLDYACKRVVWEKMEVPGKLSMCSEMCYL